MKGLVFRLAAVAAALLLASCLVSETPLLTAGNATATPIAPGLFDACSQSSGNEASDCNSLSIELGVGGDYAFLIEDDRIGARFLSIGGDDYALQMADDDDDGYQYYWARRDGAGIRFVMIWCEDLPAALVDRLIAEGAIDADEKRQTCTARSLSAVVEAAKAYATGAAASDELLTLTPQAAAQ